MIDNAITANDYAVLADFRYALRGFLAFSEGQASAVGLTPQQHQALLTIKAADPECATVGYLAERLFLKPHSASGLIDRLVTLALLDRHASAADRRQTQLRLTEKAEDLLAGLSAIHREAIRRLRPLLVELLERIDG